MLSYTISTDTCKAKELKWAYVDYERGKMQDFFYYYFFI